MPVSRLLGTKHVAQAALGGAYLGGGGGGLAADGRRLGELALASGQLRLVYPEELDPDSVVLTVSAVGAPASQQAAVDAVDYVRAVELFIETYGARPAALNTNENGGMATLNGWLQSACLGIPVVDAPCNGRAHPTGMMGSLGLHLVPDYISFQTAVGGDAAHGRRLEVTARGSLANCAEMIRQAAVRAGGLVAVARNPVPAGYVAGHAATGGISRALAVGREALAAVPAERARRVAAFLGGMVVGEGLVKAFCLRTSGGFDAGVAVVAGKGAEFELAFWNEYVTLESGGVRLATFPDLIATLDAEGLPLTSAELKPGLPVQIISAPSSSLRLGAGMRDPELLRPVETATGKEIVTYAFPQQG